MIRDHSTRATLRSFGASLLVSATLVLPFVVRQLVNRRAYQESFPIVLFALMALNSVLMVLALAPALRRLRAGSSIRTLTPGHWAGLLLGGVLVVVHANVVLDQMPCFLGVPNCD